MKEGVLSEEEVKQQWTNQTLKINEAYSESLKSSFDITKWRTKTYHRVVDFTELGEINKTGINADDLKFIGQKISTVPDTFTLNPTIKKIYEARKKSAETG